jgi:hypothetical protein
MATEFRFDTLADAIRAWVRVIGFYASLGGRPCVSSYGVFDLAERAGLTGDELEALYYEGVHLFMSPYLLGWVARLLQADTTAAIDDYQRPVRILGEGFDQTPEYLQGVKDAVAAAGTLLKALKEAE